MPSTFVDDLGFVAELDGFAEASLDDRAGVGVVQADQTGRGAGHLHVVLVPNVVFRQGDPPGLASGGQEAFFEGHVHALKKLGGLPTGKVRYDNLRSAVAKVLGFSRQRIETQRWTAFRSHYGLDVFYCQPSEPPYCS